MQPYMNLRQKDKVCLLGSASSTKELAPFDDDNFEFWALAWRKDTPRYTRLFDIHNIDRKRKRVPKHYFKYLSGLGCPIYTTVATNCTPGNLTVYPFAEVVSYLGSVDEYADGRYFASSIAYMFALAMFEGFKEIHLYGIDLVDTDEYMQQRPNLAYLIGLARGKGIKVYIPEQSSLLKFQYVYGYENPETEGILNLRLLRQRVSEYRKRFDHYLQLAHCTEGCIQELEALIKIIEFQHRGKEPKDG